MGRGVRGAAALNPFSAVKAAGTSLHLPSCPPSSRQLALRPPSPPTPQAPHPFSAVKVAGKPLRWYAQRRMSPPAPPPPRAAAIHAFELWRNPAPASPGRASPEVGFRVTVGPGASVRTLIHDLGAALGCGAHLTSLRREAVGGFSAERAWPLDVVLPVARRYGRTYRRRPG